jgi:hypothetical protein
MRAFILASSFLIGLTGSALCQDHKARAIAADAVQWGAAPPVLPKGAQLAVLAGDPGKSKLT